MILPFPVAFWTGALITDVTGAFLHDAFWFRMSAVLLMMGTIGAVLASVAGYVDYRTAPMSPKARSVATGHMVWSLVATAIFALAWFLRASTFASPSGIAATVFGAAVLFVAGYLGSELANRYRIGISDASPDRDAARGSGARAKRRR
jgi:uncharacterized membrane protein